MISTLLIHAEIFKDIKICCDKKKWYPSLDKEMPGVCLLLLQDGKMPGETPIKKLKIKELQNKTFHAGINLPKESVSKRNGARIVYIKENINTIKIIYLGGHKDKKRYNNMYCLVELIKERYLSDIYKEYREDLEF
ncbi:hypothetical protein KKG58_05490 [Patescibacteria group bacterium]|nr:hypothetical protein [Patescibacteria group bacterium]